MDICQSSTVLWALITLLLSNEAIVPITTIGQQIDKIAETALELLVSQMDEMKKRKPSPLKTPVHKQITPVLIHRKTTD